MRSDVLLTYLFLQFLRNVVLTSKVGLIDQIFFGIIMANAPKSIAAITIKPISIFTFFQLLVYTIRNRANDKMNVTLIEA